MSCSPVPVAAAPHPQPPLAPGTPSIERPHAQREAYPEAVEAAHSDFAALQTVRVRSLGGLAPGGGRSWG
ncbi:hypothetical protein ACWEWD_13705 [Streptomyces tendae]